MATLHKTLKAFIAAHAASSPPISFAFRTQESALPAITYSILTDNQATIGSLGMGFASIELTFIAQSAEDADSQARVFEADLPTAEETYDTITLHSVISQHYILNQPSQGAGDEAEPYSATLYLDIYYERLY